MGIANLLVYFRPLTQEINLSKYSGEALGVDAMCWMHRGAVATATELWMNTTPSPRFVGFFMKMVNLLVSYKIRPVIIFDGHKIPMKAVEDNTRRTKREAARAEAQALMQKGVSMKDKRVRSKFVEAIKVTQEMIDSVTQALRKAKIEYIAAPYEADAQLAYLCRSGFVKAVVTEDSDLLVYGCPRTIFKLNSVGEGQEIDLSSLSFYKSLLHNSCSSSPIETTQETQEGRLVDITISTEIVQQSVTDSLDPQATHATESTVFRTVSQYSHQEIDVDAVDTDTALKNILRDLSMLNHKMFIGVCVLTGSDYTADVHISGIGLKSSLSLIARYPSVESVFEYFSRDTKWRKKIDEVLPSPLPVDVGELTLFNLVQLKHMMAQFVFEHHYVYNPLLQCLTTINTAEYPGPTVRSEPCNEPVTLLNWKINSCDFLGELTTPNGGQLWTHEICSTTHDMVSYWKSAQGTKDAQSQSLSYKRDKTKSQKMSASDIIMRGPRKRTLSGAMKPLDTTVGCVEIAKKSRGKDLSIEQFALDDMHSDTPSNCNDGEETLKLLNLLTSSSQPPQKRTTTVLSKAFYTGSKNELLPINSKGDPEKESRHRDILALASFTY